MENGIGILALDANRFLQASSLCARDQDRKTARSK